jgi:hypothetical protein
MVKGRAENTHDYKRNSMTTLFGGVDADREGHRVVHGSAPTEFLKTIDVS